MTRLIFIGEKFGGRAYEFVLPTTTVGRGDHNTLAIRDASVSQTHCEILVYGEEVIVRDLGSSNGTFVDGIRLHKQQRPLKAGHIVKFGSIEARLELEPSSEGETTDETAIQSYARHRREPRSNAPSPSNISMTLPASSGSASADHTLLLPRAVDAREDIRPATLGNGHGSGSARLPVVATAFRILTFRAGTDELQSLDRRHLVLGIFLTWLVGVGRWWEDPRAGLLQHSGLGSVIYVFALSLFLWLILWPMTPPRWSFFNVLTFVALTSPPGILYAIPVRHGLDLGSAEAIRLLLLGVVAGWRVLLLAFYLGDGAGFSGFRRAVATLFPLVLIVYALTMLNLEKVVFRFMRGNSKTEHSVNDAAYGVLFLITMLCSLLFIPLLVAYLAMSVQSLVQRFRRRRTKKDAAA